MIRLHTQRIKVTFICNNNEWVSKQKINFLFAKKQERRIMRMTKYFIFSFFKRLLAYKQDRCDQSFFFHSCLIIKMSALDDLPELQNFCYCLNLETGVILISVITFLLPEITICAKIIMLTHETTSLIAYGEW